MTGTPPSGKTVIPVLLVLTGAVVLSFSSVFVKLANTGPTVSAFYRLTGGGVLLLLISGIRRENFRIGSGAFSLLLLAGIFFALDLFLWHRSILLVGPGLATILGNFQVFFVAVAAVLIFGESLNWRIAISIPVAVTGLFLIVGTEWDTAAADFKWGVWLGIFTAATYAAYLITLSHSRKIDKDTISAFTAIGIISMISGILLGVTILLQGEESFVISDRQTLLSLLGLAVLIQVVGWVTVTKGLPEINISLAALLLLLQPALAFIWDMLFFDRATSYTELTGACITLGAIYLGITGRKRQG